MSTISPHWTRTSRFLSRVSYGVVAEIGTDRYPRLDDAVAKARRRVLEWVGQQTDSHDLADRDPLVPFAESDRPGVKVGLALSADSAKWVTKMERPDSGVAQRTWMTEVSIVTEGEAAFLAVRNTCTVPSDRIEVPRSVPRVVRTVSDIVGLYDADEPLDRGEWIIANREDIDDLYYLVTNPRRFLPIILITDPYALDTVALARRFYGAAHVVALPNSLSYDWTERIGRPFSAFLGAVRTYNPGLNVDTSDPFDHPLALRERVRTFESSDGTGPDAFAALLLERACESNASRIVSDARSLRFSQVNADSLEARRIYAIETRSSAEIQAITVEEIAAYKKQAEESAAMEAAALDDNRHLKTDNDRLVADIFRMQAEVERFRSLLEEDNRRIEVPNPTSYREVASWAEEYLAGRVLLLPRAMRELEDAEYERPNDVYNGLLVLGNEFWRMKTGYGERRTFDEKIASLGFEYGGSIDKRNANGSYYVPYLGRTQFLEMALKKGKRREPRYCMRIYLFWDSDRRVAVVGSLPRHLDNTMS